MHLKKSIDFFGKTLTVETGKLARQANGAVWVQYGDTIVLVTAVAADEAVVGQDFFPLSVEYREKTYAAGKIPGGFIKREGKPSDKEILTARLIDRPIRPLFPDHFRSETQIIGYVLSHDKENDPDVLAGFGASCALSISNIPFGEPIATVRVVKTDGTLIINPTMAQVEKATLEFVVAGSADSIMMVEGEAKEISEAEFLEALNKAHEAIRLLVALQKEIVAEVGVPKREVVLVELPSGLSEKVTAMALPGIEKAVRITEKAERRTALKTVAQEVQSGLLEEFPESASAIKEILHDLEKQSMRGMILNEGRRLDNRGVRDIRPITCEVGVLPRTHGSALFTRGQTQSLGVVTLGSKSDEQIVDDPTGEYSKKYLLHYNFPPFSTGEAKPIRGLSRREIGHGNLAERALKPVVPVANGFPYAIRVVSEILESNGSSSMASVCSGSLSLMDAGVPVKSTVAGIAMGLIKEGERVAVLSDILGDEDHLGDMDFKVAGTKAGITAVQMDIKIQGISTSVMESALDQAREGRMHIISIMEQTLAAPRTELSVWAPRILSMQIRVEKIGLVIGPGGKTIRKIIEETGVEIDIEDDGTVNILSNDAAAAHKAQNIIRGMVEEPEVGKRYQGEVKRIKDFGAFVEIMPGREGMVHISELELGRTNKVTDVLKEGQVIEVLIKSIGADGKIALSRKAVLQEDQAKSQAQTE